MTLWASGDDASVLRKESSIQLETALFGFAFLCSLVILLGTTAFLTLAAMSGNMLGVLSFFGAVMLVNASVGAFFLAMHRDSLGLLKVLPFLDAYFGILLGSVWLVSVVDEIRGTGMRW
ncbi:MAG: hypothetical protein ACOC7K_00700 [bacterium]